MHVDRALAPAGRDLRQTGRTDLFTACTPPKCPEAVAALLRAGVISSKMTFPDTGGYKRVETWQPPQAIRQDEMVLAETYLRELEVYLTPASRAELLSRILALLSHYRLEVHSSQIEACIADDWAEDLGGYPIWAINHAAGIWRRTKRFKPQTGEVLALCEDAVAPLRQDSARLRLLVVQFKSTGNTFVERTEKLAAHLLKRIS